MTPSKIEAWIKAGYDLLGVDGIDGIKIERLAKILNLNKSGFYHYFGTMDSYLKYLLQYHVRLAKDVAAEITSCENIDPDLLLLIVKHKTFFLAESQLMVKRAHLDNAMDETGVIISKELLVLWRKIAEPPKDNNVAIAYLNIIRLFFYARIDSEKINYEFLNALADETKEVLQVVLDKNFSAHNTQKKHHK